jgi:hypothetical protein
MCRIQNDAPESHPGFFQYIYQITGVGLLAQRSDETFVYSLGSSSLEAEQSITRFDKFE